MYCTSDSRLKKKCLSRLGLLHNSVAHDACVLKWRTLSESLPAFAKTDVRQAQNFDLGFREIKTARPKKNGTSKTAKKMHMSNGQDRWWIGKAGLDNRSAISSTTERGFRGAPEHKWQLLLHRRPFRYLQARPRWFNASLHLSSQPGRSMEHL